QHRDNRGRQYRRLPAQSRARRRARSGADAWRGRQCARAAARRLRRSVRRRRDDGAALRSAVPAKARPRPATAAADRVGLRDAVSWLRARAGGPIYLGGHSYGGRQASMLAAEQPDIAAALLLLSYPLHPPAKPEQLRTAHFANLRTRAVFVSGDNDPFGGVAELERAIAAIPAATRLIVIAGSGHDLKRGRIEFAP